MKSGASYRIGYHHHPDTADLPETGMLEISGSMRI
jgi:hypothetical protein